MVYHGRALQPLSNPRRWSKVQWWDDLILYTCMCSLLFSMVLMRNRLSLSDQQRFVKESQALAQQFYRPATGGGRKYHLYSVSTNFLGLKVLIIRGTARDLEACTAAFCLLCQTRCVHQPRVMPKLMLEMPNELLQHSIQYTGEVDKWSIHW